MTKDEQKMQEEGASRPSAETVGHDNDRADDEEYEDLFPGSVVEAGALLGATITRCGREHAPLSAPPTGMHSSFATVFPAAPSAELLTRLHVLRAYLRTHQREQQQHAGHGNGAVAGGAPSSHHQPLVSAPSLLAVLIKLLGVSTSIANRVAATTRAHGGADESAINKTCSIDVAPMLSTPLRKLWVDCVAMCHSLGAAAATATSSASSGTASGVAAGVVKMDTTQFVRQMADIAGSHPRSARAAGGVRIAALDVIAALFLQPNLSSQLAPWSLEILQLCLRALRSAGNGEPTYRVSAMRTACAVATACRESYLMIRRSSTSSSSPRIQNDNDKSLLLLQNAMEDKSILESVKILKQAATDKFPEVRRAAGQFAALLAPLLVHPPSCPDQPNPLGSLDDVLTLALKNVDDESPFVADGWAEAAARCISTAVEYNEQAKHQQAVGRRDNSHDDVGGGGGGEGMPGGGGGGGSATGAGGSDKHPELTRFGSRKTVTQSLTSLPNAISSVVDLFVKAGGELAASRAGGTYSSGGRAVRVGLGLVLLKLLRIQSVLGAIGEDASISMKATIVRVLAMLGPDMDKQLAAPVSAETSAGPGSHLFASIRHRSRADPSLARLVTSRVLRQGLSEVAAEPVQLSMLHDIVNMLQSVGKASGAESSPSSPGRSRGAEKHKNLPATLNTNQLQVLLIELSHLVSTLGEAAASAAEEMVVCLEGFLEHGDHGVRYEAAVACAALATCFPAEGRKLLQSSLNEIQARHVELVTLASIEDRTEGQGQVLRMFRRDKKEAQPADPSLPHQYAIHGRALMVSIVVKDMPRLPGGISSELLKNSISVAEILVSFQFNEALKSANPGAVCLCVRSGFTIVSGVLSTGPNPVVASDVALIFRAWQKACNNAKSGSKNFAPRHELFCVDAVLTSIVVFLKYCSELLLSVPEALSQITMLLEDNLQLFMPTGKFAKIATTAQVAARLEGASASLLEAFAWLPSGSFPMAADEVFTMSAHHIRAAVENEVTCSILNALVNKEDSLLDAKTAARAKRAGQVGGARDLEETILLLTSEAVIHSERESVVHLLPWENPVGLDEGSPTYFGSAILGTFVKDCKKGKPPTALHEVGAWRRPFDPSCAGKVRLIDAAIQAFAATFGLKSGKEQQQAMDMLESMVPPLLAQLARTLGVNAALNEQDRRSKGKEDNAAVVNITAVLLSCLQAIPLHDATHNVPIGLGPQWMNKAKDLLLTLLPSARTIVRRAAGEGLSLLATLGVIEDAHFMQSTVLHSLDEVMQGNKPDGKPRAIALEPISAARSGALLTLACIQRTSYNVSQRQQTKARDRSASSGEIEAIRSHDDELPILQMMTRILPSVSYHGLFKDYFIVRTYALHSFTMLLFYSGSLREAPLSEVDKQLLRKAVELIEGNFSAAWTAAFHDLDRGQEAEKIASEVAFLASLIRLMTLVVPFLGLLVLESPGLPHRFSVMVTVILESYSSHPVVYVESMAFFEVFLAHRKLLPPPSARVNYDENPVFSCIPFLRGSPLKPTAFAGLTDDCMSLFAARSVRAAVHAARTMTLCRIRVSNLSDMTAVSFLVAALEVACASRYFFGSSLLRSLAVPSEREEVFAEVLALEKEIMSAVSLILMLERSFTKEADQYLRWVLLARAILSGASVEREVEGNDIYSRAGVVRVATLRAARDASLVYASSNVPRWQVKTLAAQLAAGSLDGLIQVCREANVDFKDDPNFNFKLASRECAILCREAKQGSGALPHSRLVFHLEEVLSSACISSAATLDHAELRMLQASSALFLAPMITAFGKIPDHEQPETSILDQYSTQIFSAVKHALNAPEEDMSENSVCLFTAGCIALMAVVESGLTNDRLVLKRLIRPIIPQNVTFFRLSDVNSIFSIQGDSDARISGLATICKVATTAKLFSGEYDEEMGDMIRLVATDLIKEEAALAAYAAAIAVDGARLLFGTKLSLAGLPLIDRERQKIPKVSSGILFENVTDISDLVKGWIVRSWSICASYSVRLLLGVVSCDESEDSHKNACIEWVKVLTSLLLTGVQDADEALSSGTDDTVIGWASGLDPSSILVDCLRGLETVVSRCPDSVFDPKWDERIDSLLDKLRSLILLPALERQGAATSARDEEDAEILPDATAVSALCVFLRQLAASSSDKLRGDSSLLVSLLTPLDLVQKGEVDFDKLPQAEKIVSTCFSAIGDLISQGHVKDDIVRAMVQVICNTILGSNIAAPKTVTDAAKQVLCCCLRHKAIDLKEQSRIASNLAQERSWEAWGAVAAVNDGAAVAQSLETVGECLRDRSSSDSQLRAVSVIGNLVQGALVSPGDGSSPRTIGQIVRSIGPDVLTILYEYGTLQIPPDAYQRRQVACAESMKILLVAYQQLSGEGTDEDVTAYLSMLFETLLPVLRFNGLPNHPSPQAGGDATLGRLSASAIVKIARTTPVPFKSCVAQLSDHDRALLEFSVRAEMTGYVVQQETQAPVKRTLNLKNFKT